MKRRVGLNGPDGLVAGVSLALLLVLGSPELLGGGRGSGAPRLVEAHLDVDLLRLTFEPPVRPTRGGWLDGIVVQRDGALEAPWVARASASGGLDLLLPAGAYGGDDLTVAIRDGIPLAGPDGTPARATPPIPVSGGAERTRLPTPRAWLQAAALHGAVYTFGGGRPFSEDAGSGPLDQIVRFDVATGMAAIEAARLPHGLWRSAVAVDPRPAPGCPQGCAYVFGGASQKPNATRWGEAADVIASEAIFRFDPESGDVTRMRVRLTVTSNALAVAFAGDAFYLFGGWGRQFFPGGGAAADSIFRYDPLLDELQELPMRLPWGLALAAAVFDPRPTGDCPRGCAYVIGGWVATALHPTPTASNPRPADVLRFDPESGTVTPLPVRFPSTRAIESQSAWTGDTAFVMDDEDGDVVLYRFDPHTLEVTTTVAPPEVLAGRQAALAWDGDALVVAGGYGPGPITDSLVRFVPGGVG